MGFCASGIPRTPEMYPIWNQNETMVIRKNFHEKRHRLLHIWQMSLWMTTLKWVKVAPGTITVDADFKKETTFLEIIEHTFWCASNKNNRSFVILLLSDDNDKERFETELKAINIIRRIQKGVENKCNAFWFLIKLQFNFSIHNL